MNMHVGLEIGAVAGPIVHFVLIIANMAVSPPEADIRDHKLIAKLSLATLSITVICQFALFWFFAAIWFLPSSGAFMLLFYGTVYFWLSGVKHPDAHSFMTMMPGLILSFFFIPISGALIF